MAQAKATGQPVVVSAKTDERTLITADPASGGFVAELTASPARVRDGQGGWRTPSANLVKGADGLWQPEAATAQIALSNGGAAGTVVSIGDGSVSARLGWSDALPAPSIDGPTATYPEVFPGVDLVVRASIESVETFLVVKSQAVSRNPKVRAWDMPFTYSGVSVKSLANGNKVLVDAAGKERMLVPAASMQDSSGKELGLTRASERIQSWPRYGSKAVWSQFGRGS